MFCNASLELPYKRVELLLRAWPLIRKHHPDATLLLLGPRDRELASRLVGENQGVELLSTSTGDDDLRLLDAYRRSWVTVLPSIGEAFGLVLAESLACGTPVVGTDSGGIPEVINSGDIGRLFNGDQRDLAGAVIEALELAQQPRTAEACRARAEELSWKNTAEAYEALYLELLGR